MYDTEKRIELVKKRMHEYHRRQEWRTVCRLSVLCTLLFLSLVGTMGIMQSQPIDITDGALVAVVVVVCIILKLIIRKNSKP